MPSKISHSAPEYAQLECLKTVYPRQCINNASFIRSSKLRFEQQNPTYKPELLLLLLLAHAGRVGLFCLQVKELSNLYRPKPQVCWGEWGGVLGAVEKVTCCVGGKGTGWAKVGDGAVEAG